MSDKEVVLGPKPTSFTKVAIVERSRDMDAIPHPGDTEKVAIELPFREWQRIYRQLLDHEELLYSARAKKSAVVQAQKALNSLEVGYNKTTKRWYLG